MTNFIPVLLIKHYLVINSRIMRWAGRVELMGERRGVYRILVGKLERKRHLGRLRRR